MCSVKYRSFTPFFFFFFGKYLEKKKKTISKQGCRDVAMAKGREKKNVFA